WTNPRPGRLVLWGIIKFKTKELKTNLSHSLTSTVNLTTVRKKEKKNTMLRKRKEEEEEGGSSHNNPGGASRSSRTCKDRSKSL
ncbi:hypothetical protein ACLOJK_022787, partial [Asimina triloba]